MTFSKTPPTETGWHYWQANNVALWIPLEIFIWTRGLSFMFSASTEIIVLDDFKEGFWGGRVPAPGTTWTEKQIMEWCYFNCDFHTSLNVRRNITHTVDGIAATTERHRKEQG